MKLFQLLIRKIVDISFQVIDPLLDVPIHAISGCIFGRITPAVDHCRGRAFRITKLAPHSLRSNELGAGFSLISFGEVGKWEASNDFLMAGVQSRVERLMDPTEPPSHVLSSPIAAVDRTIKHKRKTRISTSLLFATRYHYAQPVWQQSFKNSPAGAYIIFR